MKFKILALSYLFPNRVRPNYGIFVLNRLKAIKKYCDIKIIAPVPKFPFMGIFPRFNKFSLIPREEVMGSLHVLHPFFFTIPRFLKCLDCFTYFLVTIPVIHKMRKSFDFDIIDAHWVYPDILTAYICSKIYRKKFIVTVRGLEALHLKEQGLRKKILDFLLNKADYVITLSSELKALVEDIGVNKQKVSVILNGVDSSTFVLLDREEARKSVNIPTDKKVIVTVGSLLMTKGHHKIIEVLPALSKEFETELYIIGGVGPEGNDRKKIKNLVNTLKLNNVHFVGQISHSNLVYWYNAADIFCFASFREGCPNVIMEALACGTPVVASNVGAISDMVDTDVKGYIFDLNIVNDLENKIRTAFKTKWDRHAIKNLINNQTWDRCAKQVLEIYGRVLMV